MVTTTLLVGLNNLSHKLLFLTLELLDFQLFVIDHLADLVDIGDLKLYEVLELEDLILSTIFLVVGGFFGAFFVARRRITGFWFFRGAITFPMH